MTAATVVCAIAVCVLIAAEYQRRWLARIVAKTSASLAFVAVGVIAAWATWDAYERWIVIGLVLGAAGDVALLGKSSRAFLVGLGAFLLGHIAYIVAFGQLAAPATWIDVPAIAPIIVGGTALYLLWPRLGRMRVPVIAYVVAIITMMMAAIAAARGAALPEVNRTLLVTGAALFFVSDLAVARDKFVGASFINRAWGLPAYYGGQLLIAWSLSPCACG
jgi:uncharacterized membrane protein YhhN